ncbi:hypothetical protein CARUB_v10022262mg, partial [Capsella rubella]
MKCPTAFYETLLYKNMKEHKNPKFLSEGLLWMGSVVDDFGVSLSKLELSLSIWHDLIDSCNDLLLQSSTAATRIATVKMLGALHKFMLKGFLKHVLLSALDAEYEEKHLGGVSDFVDVIHLLKLASTSMM